MADFKVLVSDKLSKEGVAVLEAHPAIDVTVETGLAPDAGDAAFSPGPAAGGGRDEELNSDPPP